MEAKGDRRLGGAIATGSVTAGVTLRTLERTWRHGPWANASAAPWQPVG